MSAGALALSVVAVLLLCAVPAFVSASRQRALFGTDFALLLGPVVAFAVSLSMFNVPAQTGWALMLYPFVMLALSVVVLYIRVYLLRYVPVSPHALSMVAFIASSVAAALFGAT